MNPFIFLYALAEILTVTTEPSSSLTFFFKRLGLNVLLVALLEWDLLFPEEVFFPVNRHTFGMSAI
jgi:hypothetical protein